MLLYYKAASPLHNICKQKVRGAERRVSTCFRAKVLSYIVSNSYDLADWKTHAYSIYILGSK